MFQVDARRTETGDEQAHQVCALLRTRSLCLWPPPNRHQIFANAHRSLLMAFPGAQRRIFGVRSSETRILPLNGLDCCGVVKQDCLVVKVTSQGPGKRTDHAAQKVFEVSSTADTVFKPSAEWKARSKKTKKGEDAEAKVEAEEATGGA